MKGMSFLTPARLTAVADEPGLEAASREDRAVFE
jgi:hypothetical protein